MTAMEQKANKAEIDAVSGEVLTSWQRQVRSIMSAASLEIRDRQSRSERDRASSQAIGQLQLHSASTPERLF